MNRHLKTMIAILSIALTAGCSSMSAAPAPDELAQPKSGFKQASYKNASGSACGIELLDFVPIGIFSRRERAYHSALQSTGARALLKPTVSDHRIDLMVATVKCASVEGTAVY